MNALEKVAWTEVIVTALSLLVVLVLYPWLGYAATAGFGLLGFLGFGTLFMRKRGDEVVIDERDQEIVRNATFQGFSIAWMGLFLSLIVVAMWHGYLERDVPVYLLIWLIWLQFSLCYGMKGLITLRAYRGNKGAA